MLSDTKLIINLLHKSRKPFRRQVGGMFVALLASIAVDQHPLGLVVTEELFCFLLWWKLSYLWGQNSGPWKQTKSCPMIRIIRMLALKLKWKNTRAFWVQMTGYSLCVSPTPQIIQPSTPNVCHVHSLHSQFRRSLIGVLTNLNIRCQRQMSKVFEASPCLNEMPGNIHVGQQTPGAIFCSLKWYVHWLSHWMHVNG